LGATTWQYYRLRIMLKDSNWLNDKKHGEKMQDLKLLPTKMSAILVEKKK
jgi:hypothetical protein